jgi:hypothetical protein
MFGKIATRKTHKALNPLATIIVNLSLSGRFVNFFFFFLFFRFFFFFFNLRFLIINSNFSFSSCLIKCLIGEEGELRDVIKVDKQDSLCEGLYLEEIQLVLSFEGITSSCTYF